MFGDFSILITKGGALWTKRNWDKGRAETDTKLEAWYPLGHGDAGLLSNPVITRLAEKYGKNAGQIILRFEVQEGVITLPKSTNPERIKTNLEVFDFALTEDEMSEMALRSFMGSSGDRRAFFLCKKPQTKKGCQSS
ncbi:MAG: aldo/keto reductase [Eubacterium sp.]|nr:aldo/keto reductase [Eubacterium sp.]